MLYALYIFVVSSIVIFDQFTKYLIVRDFDVYQSKTLIENFFSLTYVRNNGAGFSILQNQQFFLIAISILFTIFLIYSLIKEKEENKLMKTAYLFVIGGSLGNMFDRIRLNYVVDFLDFNFFGYSFPTFNVADCFITVGCFLLIFMVFKESKNGKH